MKNNVFSVFWLTMSLSFSSSLYSASLSKQIDTLIDQKAPNAQVGIMLQSYETGDIIYHRLAESAFYPASTTKLFLSAAALKILGENFRFQTTLSLSPEQIKDNKLEGPLYLTFSGDPSLKLKHIEKLFLTLKDKNITTLDGNIIIDDSNFSDAHYAQGWTWDSMPWYYSAPVSTIVINQNKTALQIAENKTVATPVTFSHKATFPNIKLNTSVTGVKKSTAEHDCQIEISQEHQQYNLNGCWPIEHTPLTVEVSYQEPRELAIEAVKHTLNKHKIAFNGDILFRQADKQAKLFAHHNSDKLALLIGPVLTDSNNLYADALTKTLGLAKFNQGTFKQGVNAIQASMSEHFNLPADGYRLFDGSGVSRYTLISPSFISELLFQMKNDASFKPFYKALSISGETGSLEPRMASKKLKGKVVAKTGSAMGTSALAGYITVKSGQKYIFSIITNQSLDRVANMKAFENDFCELLYNSEAL